MSFQKRLDEIKKEPSPDRCAWPDAQPVFYTPPPPPPPPPPPLATPKILRTKKPIYSKPAEKKSAWNWTAGANPCKRKKVPIKQKENYKSNSEKLMEEIQKAKQQFPLPKRCFPKQQNTEKGEEKKEEEKKKIPELIFLQPIFDIHMYI